MNDRNVTEQKPCLLKVVYWLFAASEIWYNALNNNKSMQLTKIYFLGHGEYIYT